MIARLGRRAIELGVGLFALLGFVFVPLGKKTAFEHVQAIVATGPAKEAARELVEVGDKLRSRVLDGVKKTAAGEPGKNTDAKPDAGAMPGKSEALVCAEPAAPIGPPAPQELGTEELASIASSEAPEASVVSRVH